MMDLPLLTLIVFSPLVGALVIQLLPGGAGPRAARRGVHPRR